MGKHETESEDKRQIQQAPHKRANMKPTSDTNDTNDMWARGMRI